MKYGEKEILEFVKWAIKDTGGEIAKKLWDDYNNYKCRCESIPIEPPVMQKNTEMMIGQYGLKWKDEDYLIVTRYYEDGYCHEWEICGGDMETVLQVLSIKTKHDYKKDDKSVFSA